jgi:hypothetical protein
MLLRVRRPLSGSVDGVDLTQFDAGGVYSFSASLAAFLLAIGAAEPCDPNAEPMLGPARGRMFESRRETSLANQRWTGPERRRTKR